jgi:hypothetical protein
MSLLFAGCGGPRARLLHCRRSYRALEHLQGVCDAGARVSRAALLRA